MSSHKSDSKKSTTPAETKQTPAQQGSDADLGKHLAETAWRVALPFLVFSLGGIWLDRTLETEPMFSMIGVALALVSVIAVVYRYVKTHFPDMFKGDK